MACDQQPPADELYEVRNALKTLTEREATLKTLMFTDPSARTGNKFAVELKDVVTSRVDIKELRAAYPDAVAEHTHKVTTTRVELRAIDQETGELVSARRKTGSEQ